MSLIKIKYNKNVLFINGMDAKIDNVFFFFQIIFNLSNSTFDLVRFVGQIENQWVLMGVTKSRVHLN